MIVTEPGVYAEMPSAIYHADPCDTPSLSSGMITSLRKAPALAFHASSRLNPAHTPREDDGKFTIGTVSHLLFLEPVEVAARVVEVAADDWKTKAAREAREAAKAAGKVGILAHHMARIRDARRAFLANDFAARAFEGGALEVSYFWRHPRHGFWCRARADFLAESGRHICDYKATANADPAEFDRHAFNMGYHRRAAWYLEGAEAVLGRRPDHYWFVNQEVGAPHLVSVCGLTTSAIELGQEENDAAADRFARCLETGEWPGYRHPSEPEADNAFMVDLPAWAYRRLDPR